MWPIATIPKAAILAGHARYAESRERPRHGSDKLRAEDGQPGTSERSLGPIEVYGTGHLQFVDTPTRVLTDQLQSYFPVTNATIY